MSFTQSLFYNSVSRQRSAGALHWVEAESEQCFSSEFTGTNKFHYFDKGKQHSKNKTPFHSDCEITIIRIDRVMRTSVTGGFVKCCWEYRCRVWQAKRGRKITARVSVYGWEGLVGGTSWSPAGDPEVMVSFLPDSSSRPVATLLLPQLWVSGSGCQPMICDFV